MRHNPVMEVVLSSPLCCLGYCNLWHICVVISRFRFNINNNFFSERVVKHGTGFPGNDGVAILGSKPYGISLYDLVGMVALG